MLKCLRQLKHDFQVIRYCGVIDQSRHKSNFKMRITNHGEFIFARHLALDVKELKATIPLKCY